MSERLKIEMFQADILDLDKVQMRMFYASIGGCPPLQRTLICLAIVDNDAVAQ